MSTLSVKVLFFAATREMVGVSETVVEFNQQHVTLSELKEALAERYPSLSGVLATITLAVNQQYRFENAELSDGDEVALIPPLSGG